MPIVSVIMPTFNSAKHISSAVDSVLKQTYYDCELLIIDGASTDNTREIALEYVKRDARVRLIDNIDDKGPAHARSTGVRNALGKFIAFLDGDDIWLSRKLEVQLDFMARTGANFCYTQYYPINVEGTLASCPLSIHERYTFWSGLCRRGIGSPTVLVRRELLTEEIINTFGTWHGEETLWWLMMLRDGAIAIGLKQPLALYRNTENSLSKRVWRNQTAVWHNYRNEMKLGILKSSIAYFSYVIDVAVRRFRGKLCTRLKGYRLVSEILK